MSAGSQRKGLDTLFRRLTRPSAVPSLRLGPRLPAGGILSMPSLASSLLPLAAIAFLLSGCDPAVEARYQPTSVDEVFGPFSHVGGVDAEVHQLPSQPPAIDVAELVDRPCRPPGVVLKPTDMVALRETPSYDRRNEPTLMVASYEPPLRSPPPGPAYRISSWIQHEEIGAKESITGPAYLPTLEPGRSVYRNEPALYGSYRRDVYAWCNDAANLR